MPLATSPAPRKTCWRTSSPRGTQLATPGLARHKRRGLTTNLDGEADHILAWEARELWLQMDMASAHRDCIQAVDAVLKATRILRAVGAGGEPHYEPDESSRRVAEFVRHPDDPGAHGREGQELELLLVPGGLVGSLLPKLTSGRTKAPI